MKDVVKLEVFVPPYGDFPPLGYVEVDITGRIFITDRPTSNPLFIDRRVVTTLQKCCGNSIVTLYGIISIKRSPSNHIILHGVFHIQNWYIMEELYKKILEVEAVASYIRQNS